MIAAEELINPLISQGYSFYSGVPCSILKPIINFVIQSEYLDYISATGEGEAVGIAAGAYLAGKKTVIMCQNSGLGNTIGPLSSLNYPFRIPTLLIVTLRGEPGRKDEPQHELMGRITEKLLSTLDIPWSYLSDNAEEARALLDEADRTAQRSSLPYALIIKKGLVKSFPLECVSHGTKKEKLAEVGGEFSIPLSGRMHRAKAIAAISDSLMPGDAVVATTGKIGRELYSHNDRPNQLYMVGSMGCASGIGFGIQRAMPGQTVVVLDGDGAILMRMGSLATIGHYKPERFIHLVLDNEVYESTGGQPTVSSTANLAAAAAACGYRNCWRVDTVEGLKKALDKSRQKKGPHFIHVKVAAGSDTGLGRPTVAPQEVKNRFSEFLSARRNY